MIRIREKDIHSIPCKYSAEEAWLIQDVLPLLDHISNYDIIVLGGDILDSEMRYCLGDAWSYDPDDAISSRENAERSVNKARNHINAYIDRNGTDYYVVVVVNKHDALGRALFR